ncbi:MAG: KilA-N domain-containing protein [Methylococcales bacterium]|nr:KilA-N domain-containing protein [Methylococcales bacterium]
MNTNILAISGISIKQDSHGRFCLNDLHKAAGGEKRHQPSRWLIIQQTIELIEELKSTPRIQGVEQNQPVETINGGNLRGTYADKELVYAYATWISAKFFLSVIRAYDAIVSKPAYALRDLPTATPKTLTPAMLRHINKRVAWLVKNQVGTSYKALGGDILEKFNVNKRENIPLGKYAEVCDFLNCEPDEKALQGELIEPVAVEYQPPKGMVLIAESELENLLQALDNAKIPDDMVVVSKREFKALQNLIGLNFMPSIPKNMVLIGIEQLIDFKKMALPLQLADLKFFVEQAGGLVLTKSEVDKMKGVLKA